MYNIREYYDPYGAKFKGHLQIGIKDLEIAKVTVEEEQQFTDYYLHVYCSVKNCTVYKSKKVRTEIKELRKKAKENAENTILVPRFNS